jgi:hypothetical protein
MYIPEKRSFGVLEEHLGREGIEVITDQCGLVVTQVAFLVVDMGMISSVFGLLRHQDPALA